VPAECAKERSDCAVSAANGVQARSACWGSGGLAGASGDCYTLLTSITMCITVGLNRSITVIMAQKSTSAIGLSLDFGGLFWIYKFGYLRLQELGLLLYPDPAINKYPYQYAVRLATKWREKQLVIARVLPDNAGTVLMLSKKGAEFLSEKGIDEAKSGKDFGSIKGDKWVPNIDWKHHIIASSILTQLRRDGFERFVSEIIIKRFNASERINDKVPDGIYLDEDLQCWNALEVESARKTGPDMKRLIRSIISTSEGNRIVMHNNIKCVSIAYDRNSTDERGYALDHRSRVISAIKKESSRDITLQFINCDFSNYALRSYETEKCTIEADAISAYLPRMEWQKRGGELVAIDESAGFAYRIDSDRLAYADALDDATTGGGRLRAAAATVTAAKRACAQHALASRSI